jgi:hypothetical protein
MNVSQTTLIARLLALVAASDISALLLNDVASSAEPPAPPTMAVGSRR